jgi:hypothetical protein
MKFSHIYNKEANFIVIYFTQKYPYDKRKKMGYRAFFDINKKKFTLTPDFLKDENKDYYEFMLDYSDEFNLDQLAYSLFIQVCNERNINIY